MARLTVIHTSDLHNHLGLQQAGRLRALRQEHGALLLDSGDAVWAGNVYVKPGPEHAVRRMNEAGYAAMALGNREYFFRACGMLMKTAEARFPVLSANLLPVTGTLGHVRRWTVLTAPSGDRVGAFGLTPLMIPPASWAEGLSNMRFISHERAAREALAALRGRCDWTVCLSHAGYERDCEIAAEFGEIDLLLGGHSHQERDLEIINGVTISHVAPYGDHAALLCSVEEQSPSTFRREALPLV